MGTKREAGMRLVFKGRQGSCKNHTPGRAHEPCWEWTQTSGRFRSHSGVEEDQREPGCRVCGLHGEHECLRGDASDRRAS